MNHYFIIATQSIPAADVDVFEVPLYFKAKHNHIGIYTGTVKGGLPHGNGILKFDNGDEYFGEFNEGIIEGTGVLVETNGNKYNGTFRQNEKSGMGKMTYSNGDEYVGEWLENRRKGKGKYTFNNGDVFEGQWFNDKRHGKGRLVRVDGDVFEGEWLDNNWYDTNVFEGDWLDNNWFDPKKRDSLFEEAARLIVQYQQGSTSLIQRKLSLGYNRAGSIIDQLQAAGIISSKRDVLIKDVVSLEQFLKKLNAP